MISQDVKMYKLKNKHLHWNNKNKKWQYMKTEIVLDDDDNVTSFSY